MTKKFLHQDYIARSKQHLATGLLSLTYGLSVAAPSVAPNTHRTGEESFSMRGLSYNLIATNGDERIKRIANLMQQTAKGQELYNYATEKEVVFRWTHTSDDLGTYGFKKITKNADSDDKAIVLIAAHELRHAWQDMTLGINDAKVDPLTSWQINIAEEVDACAYTAAFHADYKDKTGIDLHVGLYASYQGYGSHTAFAYSTLEPEKRNFYKDAILPCFAEIRHYPVYVYKSHTNATWIFDLAKSSAEDAMRGMERAREGDLLYEPTAFRQKVDPPSLSEKFSLFSSLFTPSLQLTDMPSEIKALHLNPRKFLKWIDEMTRPSATSVQQEIKMAQRSYYRIRDSVLKGEARLSPAQKRTPRPISHMP